MSVTTTSRKDLLFRASQDGDVQTVRALMQAQPELAQARNESGLRAVTVAAYHRKLEVTALLCSHTTDLDVFEAATVGAISRVNQLVRSRPDLVDAVSPDGFTPLGLAAFFGHGNVVAFLLVQGADANKPSENRRAVCPIHSASAIKNAELAVGICRLLIDFGAEAQVEQEGGWTALHHAAANGNVELVDVLLEAGADPESRSGDGATPASLASQAGHGGLAARLRRS